MVVQGLGMMHYTADHTPPDGASQDALVGVLTSFLDRWTATRPVSPVSPVVYPPAPLQPPPTSAMPPVCAATNGAHQLQHVTSNGQLVWLLEAPPHCTTPVLPKLAFGIGRQFAGIHRSCCQNVCCCAWRVAVAGNLMSCHSQIIVCDLCAQFVTIR